MAGQDAGRAGRADRVPVRLRGNRGGDPLAGTGGDTCALVFQASPVGQITITGPGAGPHLAGQGTLADIIAVARHQARNP